MRKIKKLALDYGFSNVHDMLEATIVDSVAPAICMNDGCDYTCDMEPDQERGWCEDCQANSMKSAPVLAGII